MKNQSKTIEISNPFFFWKAFEWKVLQVFLATLNSPFQKGKLLVKWNIKKRIIRLMEIINRGVTYRLWGRRMLWWFLCRKLSHQLQFEMWDRSAAFPHANDGMLAWLCSTEDRDWWHNWEWPKKDLRRKSWVFYSFKFLYEKFTVWSDIRWP